MNCLRKESDSITGTATRWTASERKRRRGRPKPTCLSGTVETELKDLGHRWGAIEE